MLTVARRRPGRLASAALLVVALALGACGGRQAGLPLSAIVDAPLLRPGSTWSYRVTDSTVKEIWYAPEVKQAVKWRHERTSAHYLGRGKQTGELVQFALK
jgi:hypothetical protein